MSNSDLAARKAQADSYYADALARAKQAHRLDNTSEEDRARARMVASQSNAWKGTAARAYDDSETRADDIDDQAHVDNAPSRDEVAGPGQLAIDDGDARQRMIQNQRSQLGRRVDRECFTGAINTEGLE